MRNRFIVSWRYFPQKKKKKKKKKKLEKGKALISICSKFDVNSCFDYFYLFLWVCVHKTVLTHFFIRKIFIRQWASKTRKPWENLRKSPTSDAELNFLKTLIFPRAPQKLQNWVNFSFFPIYNYDDVYIYDVDC